MLARFEAFNLRAVFGGHFHGQTFVPRGSASLVTNVCCGRVVGNHDGTTFKGYRRCHVTADGNLRWEFVKFKGPVAVEAPNVNASKALKPEARVTQAPRQLWGFCFN